MRACVRVYVRACVRACVHVCVCVCVCACACVRAYVGSHSTYVRACGSGRFDLVSCLCTVFTCTTHTRTRRVLLDSWGVLNIASGFSNVSVADVEVAMAAGVLEGSLMQRLATRGGGGRGFCCAA